MKDLLPPEPSPERGKCEAMHGRQRRAGNEAAAQGVRSTPRGLGPQSLTPQGKSNHDPARRLAERNAYRPHRRLGFALGRRRHVVTLCAAVTPPFAERAAKSDQPAKAVLLWTFFALAVSFSLSASIARSSGYASGKVATVEQANESAKLAKEAYEAAKQTQQDKCKKRGARCRAAEDAVAAARAKLATAAPVQSNTGAERLAAVLGIQTSTVQLYAPLFFPLGLELGGFIFLAAGLAPRRRNGLDVAPVAKRP